MAYDVVQIASHVKVRKLDEGNVKLLVGFDHDSYCTFGLSGEAVAALHAVQADELVGYCLNQACDAQGGITASQAKRVQVQGAFSWVCPNCAIPLSPPQFPF
jgi:hypothetical protein